MRSHNENFTQTPILLGVRSKEKADKIPTRPQDQVKAEFLPSIRKTEGMVGENKRGIYA